MFLLGRQDKWKKELEHKERATRRSVRMLRTTSVEPYLKSFTFFTLAPLYVHAGVNYSLPDQFELEAGPQDRVFVDYQRTVIGGLGRWDRYIEGISNEVWEDFCHYLSTVVFVSFPKKLVWQIRQQAINVEGTSQEGIVKPHDLPVRLAVFLPDGNKGRMHVRGGLPAKLWWAKPHPRLVESSNVLLACQGRIEDAG